MARSQLPVGTVRGNDAHGCILCPARGVGFDTGNWLLAAEYRYCNNYPLELSSLLKCFCRDCA